jgi:hypothetical protein
VTRSLFGALVLAVLMAGCAASARRSVAPGVSPAPVNAAHTSRAAGNRNAREAKTRFAACPAPKRALNGVYHPSRLRVLDPCRRVVGTVALVRHEPDGDLHIDVALDSRYRGLLNATNISRQHGDLVVEFMARDGGHLPEPRVRDRVALVGAWVDDAQHGWNELHPVWSVSLNGGAAHTSGPQFGGSPAADRSSDAAGDCRTATGARCRGYGASGGGTRTVQHQSAPSIGGGTGACEPGYSPCLPRVGDLNCNEIPAAKKPVRVTGSDPYRLDADHNGIGCQSG